MDLYCYEKPFQKRRLTPRKYICEYETCNIQFKFKRDAYRHLLKVHKKQKKKTCNND